MKGELKNGNPCDHDDAEQIWALLLDYKDLLMDKEVE